MKKTSTCILYLLVMGSFFTGSAQTTVTVVNSSAAARTDEVVSIPWSDLVAADKTIDTSDLRIVEAGSKKPVPYQYETMGSGKIMNLLLQVSVGAHGKTAIRLMKGKPATVATKTYCRYVPERKDDFAWENDRIAFRAYGKALEGTNEDAHGFDVWVKRTDQPVLNRRYKGNDYHNDHGDGLDYYHVGLTLGAGNIAPYTNDSIRYPGNYRKWKVLDNGPIRSTFQLFYDSWKVEGKDVGLALTISIDAGSQLHKVEGVYEFAADSMRVAIGIIKRKEAGTAILDESARVMGYWEPEHGKDGITGVGCVMPSTALQMKVTDEQLLSLLYVYPGKKITYYRGAAWDKAGVITSAKAWFAYLTGFQDQLKHPLEFSIR